jgi:hypothetical protein
MTAQTPSNQNSTTAANVAETKPNDKEINFRMQERAMQEKYEKMLAQERNARIEAERKAQEAVSKRNTSNDDDEDDEPYVDHKKLKREQAKFGQQIKQETQGDIQKAVHQALQEERKNNWIKQNGDFYDVLQHAEKLAIEDPEFADTILEMPEGFERQKLVYKTIKKLNLHKPAAPQSTIQEKIDANRRSPFYQPSGIGTAPYASEGNFSAQGQKDAYTKMQELKNRLRI